MTYRREGESARAFAARVAADDNHSETETEESIARALEEVEAARDIANNFIAGMLLTMQPGAYPGEVIGYVIMPGVFREAAACSLAFGIDRSGRIEGRISKP